MTDDMTPMTGKALIARNVSAALTAHFKASGETQAALAARAGIVQSSVSKYTSGTNAPNSEQLVALAAALGTTLDELVLGGRGAADKVRRREVIGEIAGMPIVVNPEVEPDTIELRTDDQPKPRKVKL